MRDIAQQERTWEAAGHQLAAIAHRESTVRSQLHHFAIVCTKQEQTLQAHRRQCHAGLKHSGDNLGAVHLGLGVVCFIRTPPWQMNHWNGHTVARMNAVSNTMSERFRLLMKNLNRTLFKHTIFVDSKCCLQEVNYSVCVCVRVSCLCNRHRFNRVPGPATTCTWQAGGDSDSDLSTLRL